MTAKEKARRAAASAAIDGVLKYIKKSPEENFVKMLNLVERFADGSFPEKNFDAFRKAATDKNNVWHNFAMGLINDLDHNALKKMLLAVGLGAAIDGTKKVRENREKYKCNIQLQGLLVGAVRQQIQPLARRYAQHSKTGHRTRHSFLYVHGRRTAYTQKRYFSPLRRKPRLRLSRLYQRHFCG